MLIGIYEELNSQKIPSSAYIILILACFIIISSFGISDSYWQDEVYTILRVSSDTVEGLLDLDNHTPLYFVILWVWINLFGSYNPIITRILGLIIGAFSIWFFYLFAQRFYDESTALIASFLLATSNIIVYYSQEIRPHALVVLLSILSSYTYKDYVETRNTKSLRYYTLINALLLHTHILAVLLPFSHGLHYVCNTFQRRTPRSKEDFRRYFCEVVPITVSYISTALLFLPWLALKHDWTYRLFFGEGGSWIPYITLDIFLYEYSFLFSSYLVLIIFVLLSYYTSKKDIFLLIWAFLPPITLYLVSVIVKPAFLHKYILYTVPALMLLLARWVNRIKIDYLRKITMLSLVVFVAISSYYPQDLGRYDYEKVADTVPKDVPTILVSDRALHTFSFAYNSTCFLSSNYTRYQTEKILCGETRIMALSHTVSHGLPERAWVIELNQSDNIDYSNIEAYESYKERFQEQGVIKTKTVLRPSQTKYTPVKKPWLNSDIHIYTFEKKNSENASTTLHGWTYPR